MVDTNKEDLTRIEEKIDKLSVKIEMAKISNYITYLESPKKILWSNFLAGVARGFGTIVGLTIVTAGVVYFLQFLLRLNLPLISVYIADFIKLIQKQL